MQFKSSLLLLSMGVSQLLTATNFTVINDTDLDTQVWVQYADTKQPAQRLQKGQTKFYETGFNKVQHVFWQQQLPRTDDDIKNKRYCLAYYATNLFDFTFVATAGTFRIMSDGQFKFDFNFLGIHIDQKREPEITCTVVTGFH